MTKRLKNRSTRTSLVILFGAAAALVAMNAHAALISTDGGLGVYDTTNNVTWTSNANLFASQYGEVATIIAAANSANGGAGLSTGVVSSGEFGSNGRMSWAGANAWVYWLNVTNYGGSNQWALPTTVDRDVNDYGFPDGIGSHHAQSSSQLAQLFYGGLGQVAGSSITTTHNASYSLFSNLQSFAYWSGTEYSASPGGAWIFNSTNGGLYVVDETIYTYALAVSPGQVSAVPLPGAAWLLGSGLLGLVSFRRRKAETLGLR